MNELKVVTKVVKVDRKSTNFSKTQIFGLCQFFTTFNHFYSHNSNYSLHTFTAFANKNGKKITKITFLQKKMITQYTKHNIRDHHEKVFKYKKKN